MRTFHQALALQAVSFRTALSGVVPILRAYNPDEPRVPGGETGGGEWTAGGGAAAGLVETTVMGGKRVHLDGSPLPPHIQALTIPPAWTHVTYDARPGAVRLVTGKDAKGKWQPIYSAEHTAQQAAKKFARVNELSTKFHALEAENNALRSSANARTAAHADATHLIMKMGVRPGSETDTGAKVKAYGATTLEGRHVVQEGGDTFLRFVGKKGVNLNLKVTDPGVRDMLTSRAAAAGSTGKLFGGISAQSLRDHVHAIDSGFKVKDFRTHLGTATALQMVSSMRAPSNMAEYKKSVMDVAKAVSSKLGNTPAVALQSYIAPEVFGTWRHSAHV